MPITIVWDLDETLCHTKQDESEVDMSHPDAYQIQVDGPDDLMWGYKRPHAVDVVKALRQLGYRQMVWTHGVRSYGQAIVNILFPFDVPVYTREDCEQIMDPNTGSSHPLKNLAKLYKMYPDMNERNTIMIDNRVDVAYMNYSNHIHVRDFIPPDGYKDGDKKDMTLLNLYQHLSSHRNISDVRLITGKSISTRA